MKLLKLTLHGEYKGLKDQTFDFSDCDGEVIALIGLNGSGKSHLLELICETFAWLERYERKDFRTRSPLPFAVELEYLIKYEAEQEIELQVDVKISRLGNVVSTIRNWLNDIEEGFLPLPQNIIGYSSGLNENLQRSFMKNSLQYFDVVSAKAARMNRLSLDLDESGVIETNKYYYNRYPGVFSRSSFEAEGTETFQDLGVLHTEVPMMKFLDYDCVGLLVASFSILPSHAFESLLNEIEFRHPVYLEIGYDLRKTNLEHSTIADIQQLIRLAGDGALTPKSDKTSDAQFDHYGILYLAGTIGVDLENEELRERLLNAYYGSPTFFFEKLYRIQLLGTKNWKTSDKRSLRKDCFTGNVKKPLKSMLPISVNKLLLSNANGVKVDFNDLSDGETQLIQIVCTAQIFNHEETLYVFDEPETHLNPTWRTHFHQSLSRSLSFETDRQPNTNQVLVSTHSPFMVSALKRNDVLHFQRMEDAVVNMFPAEYETYGAAFGVLIKQYFGVKSLISQTAIDEIKRQLDSPPAEAIFWIEENLGDSPEKAYLLRKLQQ